MMGVIAEVLRNYLLRKNGLLKSEKDPVSEHPSAVNVLTGRKHC